MNGNSSKTLYTSLPNLEGRLEKELRAHALLHELAIPFIGMDHEETASYESCLEVETQLDIQICKNLFLCNSAKTEFYLLMMPGEKKFQTGKVSKQIGSSRLSFASAEYMEEFLDITPGSVSVLGLMNDVEHRVTLLIDQELLEKEYVGCHPCINTSSIKIKVKDLMEKFLPYTGHEAEIVVLE